METLHNILLDSRAIADIAGVTPAAVSNWRTRHEGFPAATQTSGRSPLYAADEIQTWLVEQGRLDGPIPARHLIEPLLDELTSFYDLPGIITVASVITLFVAVQSGETRGPDRDFEPQIDWATWDAMPENAAKYGVLRSQLDAIDASFGPGGLTELLRPSEDIYAVAVILDLIEAIRDWIDRESGAISDIELLLDTYESSRDRFASAHLTPEWLRTLIVELAENSSNSSVLDLACGTGRLLRITTWFRDGLGGLGIERNHETVWHAELWNAIYDTGAEVIVGNGLDPSVRTGTAGTVVCVPPFALEDWGHADIYLSDYWELAPVSARNATPAWLQRAWLQLDPGGTAVVVTEPAMMFRNDGPSRALREALIEREAIIAVVELPKGIMPTTSIGATIWVLSKDPTGRPPLLVDATNIGDGRKHGIEVTRDEIREISTLVNAWRRGELLPAQDVSAYPYEPTGDGVDLTPRQHAPVDLRPTDDILRELEQAASSDALLLREPAGDLAAETGATYHHWVGQHDSVTQQWLFDAPASRTTLAELADVRRGVTRLRRPGTETDEDAKPLSWATVTGGTEEEFAARPKQRTADAVQPGDILLPAVVSSTDEPIRPVIAPDAMDGLIIGNSVIRLRPIDSTGPETGWLRLWLETPPGQAALQRAYRGQATQSARTSSIESIEVPLPTADVMTSAVAHVKALTTQADQLAAAADALRTQARLAAELAATAAQRN